MVVCYPCTIKMRVQFTLHPFFFYYLKEKFKYLIIDLDYENENI